MAGDVDRVVLAGTRIPSYDWMNRVMRDEAYTRRYYGVGLEAPRRGLTGRARKLGAKLGLLDPAPGKAPLTDGERRGHVTGHLRLSGDRVHFADHHACHAAAAYHGSPFGGRPALVLTNDNSGDGLCGTVSSASGVALTRHESTPSGPGSLGSFYTLVTLLLGMKPGEHEYKVMGLAPYAPARETERAVAALGRVFAMAEGKPSRFEWRRRGPLYRALLEATLGLRFDGIAGGAQQILEDALMRWTRLARQRYGGERLALGGGVFMNVKANMLIADERWLGDLFVFPSCGDESNAVGAAYLGYLDLCAASGTKPAPKPFGPAYLGPEVLDADIEAVISGRNLSSRYKVSEHAAIEEKIAELLVSDGVVARCAGRMEFGARALGNRSILANPSDHRVVDVINRMIKSRDFWMPFAPTVLRERESDYLLNPKSLASPYMMLAFPTNAKRRDEIVAALHPSFNLHGEPLVCSAEDAVDTFERSRLPHLALERWLISKK